MLLLHSEQLVPESQLGSLYCRQTELVLAAASQPRLHAPKPRKENSFTAAGSLNETPSPLSAVMELRPPPSVGDRYRGICRSRRAERQYESEMGKNSCVLFWNNLKPAATVLISVSPPLAFLLSSFISSSPVTDAIGRGDEGEKSGDLSLFPAEV